MLQPKILIKGIFYPKNIRVNFENKSNRKVDSEIESRIDSIWDRVHNEAREQGKLTFNGKIYRLNNYHVSNSQLEITFSQIEYKTRIGIIEQMDKVLSLGEDYLHKNVAIGGLIKTADNKYVFGIKSGKTMNQSKEDIIGGMVEPDFKITSGEMLIEENFREIKEELNVDKELVQDLHVIGLVLSSNGGIIIITSCSLTIDSDVVKKKFDEDSDEEHSDLRFVEAEVLNNYLDELGGYRPLIKDLI